MTEVIAVLVLIALDRRWPVEIRTNSAKFIDTAKGRSH